MKKIVFLVLMGFGTLSWATPKPEEYSINVHVGGSRWVMGLGEVLYERLSTTINGEKYELDGEDSIAGKVRKIPVLAPGDYKAKLVQDVHMSSVEFSQTYEFLLPSQSFF